MTQPQARPLAESRLAALDVARGLAMLLVVIMHSVLGVERVMQQAGMLHDLVSFAQSFRIPAFFLISGLFLRRAMNLSWADLFAKRIYGLLILYLVWLTIHLGLRSMPAIIIDPWQGLFGLNGFFRHYAQALIEPFGLLWFIHMMIVFLLMSRLIFTRPDILPLAILLAAGLETARVATGWVLIDEFAGRGVYFLIGLWLGPLLLPGGRTGPRTGTSAREPSILTRLREAPGLSFALLGFWFIVQLALVSSGLDAARGVSLLAALLGAAAVILFGLTLVTVLPDFFLTRLLRLIGERSIVIYLVFTIPMSMIREVVIRFAPGLPVDIVSLIVIISAVGAALGVERLVRQTRFEALFSRPVFGAGRSEPSQPPK